VNYSFEARDDGVTAAVERYLEVRNRLDHDGGDWGELADVLTDDAVYVDCAWGRTEGKAAIAEFLRTAMVGIDFVNPVDFWAADGPRVMVKWRQVLPGRKPDGNHWQQSAVTTLIYAGDGLFRYVEDLLNVTHCVEDIVESGWQGGPGFNAPPERPNRNFDPATT
jgi:SnoaL-like protein